MSVVEWQAGQPQAEISSVLDALAARVNEVYLHIDFDCFAPEVAPGVVDQPVPGGMSANDADLVIRATAARLPVRAVTFATYNPERDPDERTLRLVLRLLGVIGEVCADAA